MKFISSLILMIGAFGCMPDKGESIPKSPFYTMVNLSKSPPGESHIIELKNGKVVLIDVGTSEQATEVLIPHLRWRSLEKIDMIFISHAHFDHYGGLLPLLSNDILIGTIYFNLPSKERCEEESWGCVFSDINAIVQKAAEQGVSLQGVRANMNFDLNTDTKISVLYAFDLSNSPVPNISINDESLIMLVRHKGFRFLFTGDLDKNIGSYLAQNGENLQADVLKVPHHGASDIAPSSFFDVVNPSYCLIPAPGWLWHSPRSVQVRNWALSENIPTYVSGVSGTVYIDVGENNNLLIRTQ